MDDNRLGQAATKYPRAHKFHDFRKMFDDAGKAHLREGVADPYLYKATPTAEERQQRIEGLLARNGHDVRRPEPVAVGSGNGGGARNGSRAATARQIPHEPEHRHA